METAAGASSHAAMKVVAAEQPVRSKLTRRLVSRETACG